MIDNCLDCFVIVEQQLKKINAYKGEIDTLNQEKVLLQEQVDIKVKQNEEQKKQIKKDKAKKIWLPIVSAIGGAAITFGITKAVK